MSDKLTAEDYLRIKEDLEIERNSQLYDLELRFSRAAARLAQRAIDDGLVDSCGRFPSHADYGKDKWNTLIERVADIQEVYHEHNQTTDAG